MRWEFGSVLPPDIRYNLSEQEVDFFTIPFDGCIFMPPHKL